MKVKTSELSGAALDWAVAKCEGGFNLRLVSTYGTKTAWIFSLRDDEDAQRIDDFYLADSSPSNDWAQGGPIIEREEIDLTSIGGPEETKWVAHCLRGNKKEFHSNVDPNPLIAAMRCYCCTKFGNEVEIPEELL